MSSPTHKRVASVVLSTGVTLPYVEQGAASGVPVLLLHGYADSWRFFEPLLDHLPDSVHAFAPTQRGHGDATRPRDRYRQEDFAADVAAFMDAVGLKAAVIAGQSSGGYTAQRFAIDHPERTLGLVLIGTPRDFRDKPAAWEFLRALPDLTDPVDPQFVRDVMMSTITRPLPPAFLDTPDCRKRQAARERLAGHLPGAAGSCGPDRERHHHGTHAHPVGRPRRARAPPRPRATDGGHRRRELVTYHGTGHAVACEQPTRTAADLAAFAQRVSGPALTRP